MRTRFGARKTYGRLIIKEMESHEDGGGNVGARGGGGGDVCIQSSPGLRYGAFKFVLL